MERHFFRLLFETNSFGTLLVLIQGHTDGTSDKAGEKGTPPYTQHTNEAGRDAADSTGTPREEKPQATGAN